MVPVVAQHGTLGPEGCFIGAAICAVVGLYCVACALFPSWRAKVRWGRNGSGGPMSPVGCLAWAAEAAAWGTTLYAQAVKFTPIVNTTGWILGGAFAALMVAALGDWIYYRGSRKAG